jgi:nicotinic acid mononucleotide adenylyltransferase
MSIDYRPDNTFIFTLARMNPPTPGHLFLIRSLIIEAVSKNVQDVYVILSKTNDNNENPIPCPEKINVLGEFDDVSKTMINSEKERMIHETSDEELKSKIQSVRVHTICVPDRKGATPFTPVYDILGQKQDIPDLNLFLIIGDDRQNMLDSITGFFFKWPNVNSVDGIILPREEMSQYKELSRDSKQLERLNMDDVPVNAMSASFVRNIVKNDKRDKFRELYLPYLEESKISHLYDTIYVGLKTLGDNDKPESPSPPLKYTYPMIKGLSTIETTKVTSAKTRRKKVVPSETTKVSSASMGLEEVVPSETTKVSSASMGLEEVVPSETTKVSSVTDQDSPPKKKTKSNKLGGKKSNKNNKKYIKKRKTRKMKKTKKQRK